MTQAVSLEPATSIIDAFGGLRFVVAITGASRTRVYRWTQPRDRGGTGGLIPINHAQVLLEYARENGVAVSAEAFFSASSSAPLTKARISNSEAAA